MRKAFRFIGAGLALAMSVSLAACGNGKSSTDANSTSDASSETQKETQKETEPFVPEIAGVFEAEDGTFVGGTKIGKDKAGFSGTGYVEGFAADGDACIVKVSVEKEGFYDLLITNASGGGHKENFVAVDGSNVGKMISDETVFTDSVITNIYFEAGEHEVEISSEWGWIMLDKITVQTSAPIDSSIYEASSQPVNPNATESTKKLMSYLSDIYGEKILSGQNCDTGMYGKEFRVIKDVADKTPAVLGLDFIEYSPSRVENGSSSKATDYAIQFNEAGGIVTFCWHWNAPSKYLTGEWYRGFYTDATNINLAKIMNGEDEEGYDLLMKDIDAIAAQLKILQDNDVPVLWRPLHEASGGWFWWGDSGPEAYIELYKLLYDKLTNEYGLNNLIWVWNGQNKDWYPGDEYVDMIGEDIYPGERVYTSQVNKYLEAAHYTDTSKMVILSENGCVLDPELAKRDGAMWGLWCTWGGEFVAKDGAFFAYSDKYTEKEQLKTALESEIVITLDELPNLKEYETGN